MKRWARRCRQTGGGERERTRRAAEAALGGAGYERAWQAGARLSIQEAVDLAASELMT